MEKMRKPLQGVINIVRFNWHFYLIALAMVLLVFIGATYADKSLQPFIYMVGILTLGSTVVSLLASIYVYDLSGLYQLNWVNQNNAERLILNINAGFDETSELLQEKFKNSDLIALDFYDPIKHTEISIKRARKAYPSFSKTKTVESTDLQQPTDSADKIFVIFSAHEIRNEKERTIFFKELKRIIKPGGEIYVTEHLRDISNFLVYNIGFFHFYSKYSWMKIFNDADLTIKHHRKLTPFVSTFILHKNGNTL